MNRKIIIGFSVCVLAIIILTALLWREYSGRKKALEDAKYWKTPTFKTDTIFQPIPYAEPAIPYKEVVPPKTVIRYLPSKPGDVKVEVRDSIIYVTDNNLLNDNGAMINIDYIKQYPGASKLIYAKFTGDSLQLDLLNIRGTISRQLYPVDYSSLKYEYRNNSLRAEELKTSERIKVTKKKSAIQYDGIYLYGDRDLINKSNSVQSTIALDIWKLRLQGYGQYNLDKVPNKTEAGVRVGFRLF